MIPENRCRSNGISDKGRRKYHTHIHQYTVSSYSVLSRIFDQLDIIEHAYKIHGNIAHKLRRTVSAGPGYGFPIKGCSAQTQDAVIIPPK